MFACNATNGDTSNGLFLTTSSLKRLLYNQSSGWLDDLVFTFFATIINCSKEYNITSGFNDNLLCLMFSDSKDSVKRENPYFCTNISRILNISLKDTNEDIDLKTKEMKKWV